MSKKIFGGGKKKQAAEPAEPENKPNWTPIIKQLGLGSRPATVLASARKRGGLVGGVSSILSDKLGSSGR